MCYIYKFSIMRAIQISSSPSEQIRKNIDFSRVTLMVCFNFSKAFDSVRHDIVLQKLRNFGCTSTALTCIWFYLKGWMQDIISKSLLVSTWLQTTTSVPQGSVLSPLLFLILMGNIENP